MATQRTYGDACGAAHALDLVGERWALLVVRELTLGPRRFSDLRAALPGISSNVLSHRLDELEADGIVTRRVLPPPAASRVYELTDWGAELGPVIQAIGRWGARSPTHRRDAHLSDTSFVLSMRTNFDAARADGVRMDLALVVGAQPLHALVDGVEFRVEPGTPADPVVTVTGAPEVLAGITYGGLPLRDAIASGAVSVTGAIDAAERFFTLFTLPEPAPLPVGTSTS
jgi:DNA-binding HxlR family transcriptional regulator